MWKHNASGVIYRMGGSMKWSISAKDEWPKGRVATATEQSVLVENVLPLWEGGLSPNLVWYSVAVPTYILPRPNPFMFLRVITETPFQSDCRVGFSGETVISGLTKTCTHWPRVSYATNATNIDTIIVKTQLTQQFGVGGPHYLQCTEKVVRASA